MNTTWDGMHKTQHETTCVQHETTCVQHEVTYVQHMYKLRLHTYVVERGPRIKKRSVQSNNKQDSDKSNEYQHTDKTLTLQTLKHEVLIIVCMCVDSVDIT